MSAEPQFPHSPRNHDIHHQIKDISDRLRPHLIRLSQCPADRCGDVLLYQNMIDEMKTLCKQISNQDGLCAMQNALSHLQRALDLAKKSSLNEEVLWHLQEVMAFLFKIQNLPA
jgi:hypothetical protein